MILYHGSTYVVETPDVRIGRDNLDFGKGFYPYNEIQVKYMQDA